MKVENSLAANGNYIRVEFECLSRDVLLVRIHSGRGGEWRVGLGSAVNYTHYVNMHNAERHTRQ